MGEPWFRQFYGLSVMPIRWQGWAMEGVFVAIEVPLFFMSGRLLAFIPWWAVVLLHLSICLTFNTAADWKSERS